MGRVRGRAQVRAGAVAEGGVLHARAGNGRYAARGGGAPWLGLGLGLGLGLEAEPHPRSLPTRTQLFSRSCSVGNGTDMSALSQPNCCASTSGCGTGGLRWRRNEGGST